MTYLGDASLPRRILGSLAGLFRRPARAGGPPAPVWVIGHRGAARHAPENTIASFRTALDLGADGVETDVCVTRDGCFVLWHDAEPSESVALVRQLGAEGDFLYLPTLPLLGSELRRPVRECDKAVFLEHYGYVLAKKGLANPLGDGRRPEVKPALLEDLLEWAPGEPRLRHVVLDTKMAADCAPEAVRLLRLVAERARRPDHRPDLTYHFLNAQSGSPLGPPRRSGARARAGRRADHGRLRAARRPPRRPAVRVPARGHGNGPADVGRFPVRGRTGRPGTAAGAASSLSWSGP